MHPILEQFLDRWVWPTMPGAPGAEFRLRLTKEKCVKGWEISLKRTLGEIEEELASNDEAWKKEKALRGYAAEGVHMSIKQMSGQLLSIDIADQERYIDLQKCTYPGCTACLMYCPAEGSIIEVESGRSMVPPAPEAWQEA